MYGMFIKFVDDKLGRKCDFLVNSIIRVENLEWKFDFNKMNLNCNCICKGW